MKNVKVGLKIIFQGGIWTVTDMGCDNWWGVTNLKTGAFISMTTEEISSI